MASLQKPLEHVGRFIQFISRGIDATQAGTDGRKAFLQPLADLYDLFRCEAARIDDPRATQYLTRMLSAMRLSLQQFPKQQFPPSFHDVLQASRELVSLQELAAARAADPRDPDWLTDEQRATLKALRSLEPGDGRTERELIREVRSSYSHRTGSFRKHVLTPLKKAKLITWSKGRGYHA